ncbi:MAG: hypothetical protein KHW79_00900 [Clostridiales bacterium]|nr:hypothetical protein [Clostridiales bacterium]
MRKGKWILVFFFSLSLLFNSCAPEKTSDSSSKSTVNDSGQTQQTQESKSTTSAAEKDISAPEKGSQMLSSVSSSQKIDANSSGKTVIQVSSATAAQSSSSGSAVTEKPNIDNRNFDFDGPISEEVLNNYLSKAVTHNGLVTSAGYGTVPPGKNADFDEDFRMLKNIGAMFYGRAAHVWGTPDDEEQHFQDAKQGADKVHAYNSKIILQACVFEAIYESHVQSVPIPGWVFEAFGLPIQKRNFRYADMLFSDGRYVNQWGNGCSVPDLSKTEAQMWMFYRCARYIDSGYEAIHMGQMMLMCSGDSNLNGAVKTVKAIRKYASTHARRHWVLLDAHTHGMTYKEGGQTKLLLDFHSYPIRPKDLNQTVKADGYQPVILETGYIDSIFGKSVGGVHPAGWKTDSNPFLVEFDNSGYEANDRDYPKGTYHPWGYDEITWFARQPASRRTAVIREFYRWINDRYPNGHLQFPTRVPLAYGFELKYTIGNESVTLNNIYYFKANRQSQTAIEGFGLEDTLKSLWKSPR